MLIAVALMAMLVPSAAHGQLLGHCRAVDGDTLRCGSERVRLLGIDAPEMPGHCRRGRRCVKGDPNASREWLAAGLGSALQIVRIGEDRYGRTLAIVSGDQGNLSCRQLAGGAAVYRADWDEGGRVAAACPDVAR